MSEVPRHWRNQPNVRNLGRSKESLHRIEIDASEKRLMGAMLVITDGENLALFPDESKKEALGVGSLWSDDQVATGRYGVPAGGRKSNETVWGTIRRELKEELPLFNQDYLCGKRTSMISPYPFIVNQLSYNSLNNLDSVRAISVSVSEVFIPPDEYAWKALEESGVVRWSIDDLANRRGELLETDGQFFSQVRPQVIVAAAFSKNMLSKNDVIHLNQLSLATGASYSEEKNIPLVNGATNYDGLVNPLLSREEKQYLGIE